MTGGGGPTATDDEQPQRLTRFRTRPCPTCGAMMRCRPGYAEGRAMLTWRCGTHGYWTDDEGGSND